jgi:hypothetical protein
MFLSSLFSWLFSWSVFLSLSSRNSYTGWLTNIRMFHPTIDLTSITLSVEGHPQVDAMNPKGWVPRPTQSLKTI